MDLILKKYLKEKQILVDELLKQFLDSSSVRSKIIHEAMRYSVLNGGKRLRPILAFLGNKISGGNEQKAYAASVSLELIHCYSLVHDDLPALDNDDYRRGKLTSHKKFGEDIAILAGDALLTKAFEVISNIQDEKILKKVLREISIAVGSTGMIGGQVADLQSENLSDLSNSKNKNLLKYIHKNKTSKLIETSLVVGALTANADDEMLKKIRKYGECLGLMFQITDDILDIVGDKKKLGKRGSDADNKKLTYPCLYGLDESRKIVKRLKKKGFEILRELEADGKDTSLLKDLLEYVENRAF